MSNPHLQPHHRLDVHCRIGSLHIDVDLELSAPWTLLFGPSGSGKSSLLRAACGLLEWKGIAFSRQQPDGNWLALQEASTRIPPHLRGLRWAPQHASLFPHLTVRENIEFGTRADNSTAQNKDLISEAMRLFRIDNLVSRKPCDLSGGERQRVSLARAFAASGCMLMLLDEPFNGIDHALRDELLPEMRAWLHDHNIPALSVTHDVEEALQLQADVVLLRDGKVEAQGPASEVLHAERERLLQSLGLSR
ncbi:MAG: ATP-binding cassette domain-containing protein [Acidobacteriaceae bacterium]